MSSRNQQAAWRREQILNAALVVFSDRGIDGASVKDLATAAQVTPGLLYHYFASKEAIVTALFTERGFVPELRRLLEDQGDRPAADVLPELLAQFDAVLESNQSLMRLFFAAADSNESARVALNELVSAGCGLLAGYLQTRVDIGELRAHNTMSVGATLFSVVAVGRRTGAAVDIGELVNLTLFGLLPRD